MHERDGILWTEIGVLMPLEDVAIWYPGSLWKPTRKCEPIIPRNSD